MIKCSYVRFGGTSYEYRGGSVAAIIKVDEHITIYYPPRIELLFRYIRIFYPELSSNLLDWDPLREPSFGAWITFNDDLSEATFKIVCRGKRPGDDLSLTMPIETNVQLRDFVAAVNAIVERRKSEKIFRSEPKKTINYEGLHWVPKNKRKYPFHKRKKNP